MTTYIITGKAGSGKSLLAKRIAMSYPHIEWMTALKNVFLGTFVPWTSRQDCVAVSSISRHDTLLCQKLLDSIRTGKIPEIDEGCALVLVFQELPDELKNLKDVFYVNVESTADTLAVE